MEKLIRIKIYFTSGQSVEYHTKEYSDSENDLMFCQGKTEITVNHKNIAVLEIEDVEKPSEEEENKSDVKDEFEPGYVYWQCLARGGCINSFKGFRDLKPDLHMLNIKELNEYQNYIKSRDCPLCGTPARLLYI